MSTPTPPRYSFTVCANTDQLIEPAIYNSPQFLSVGDPIAIDEEYEPPTKKPKRKYTKKRLSRAAKETIQDYLLRVKGKVHDQLIEIVKNQGVKVAEQKSYTPSDLSWICRIYTQGKEESDFFLQVINMLVGAGFFFTISRKDHLDFTYGKEYRKGGTAKIYVRPNLKKVLTEEEIKTAAAIFKKKNKETTKTKPQPEKDDSWQSPFF